MYSVNLTAYVYDASGNPVTDGTIVNFNIDVSDVNYTASPDRYTWQYYPVRTGNLNGNNSQYAYVPTSGGKATIRYGWFPDNKIPAGFVMITAALNNTPSIHSTIYLILDGTTNVGWTLVPMVGTATTAPNSSSTPLSPIIALLSLIIGAAIVLAVRRK